MIRTTLPGVVLASLMAVTTHAGGWGVITVRELPDVAEVGKPFSLSFTVMPHGRERAKGLSGTVEAVSGGQRVTAAASETQEPGVYQASVVLPRRGDWVLTIKAGYQLTLLPIAALDRGEAARAPVGAAERGTRLFVAKGCVTCHQNSLATSNRSVNVGPALVPNKYQPEFLARMLADPVANIPPRPESPVRMPNLNLAPHEIASLVAFINSTTATARRQPG